MCIYENKIKNLKYQPNKKNMGVAPTLKDYRLATVSTACGWCKECRKRIANNWKIRLMEELKVNKNCEFVSLSFSPKSIKKLETDMYIKKWQGIENEDGEMLTDVNKLATYAVRMWSERWRKIMKKAPRHWFITELGHTATERIHLHGLIWGSKELIKKTWQYGNVDIGEYVNSATINYIIKYVTKIDKDHYGYKQKVICSKGIGKNYIEKNRKLHKFVGEDTITYYRTNKGVKMALPRYYKEKLWNEEEREKIWQNNLDKKEIYLDGEKIHLDNITLDEWNNKLNTIREKEKMSGFGNNKMNNIIYTITNAMRLKKDEWKESDKENNLTTKREVLKIIENNECIKCEKSNGVKQIIYGKYIGTTTESQRKMNELIEEANAKQISVRVLRLIKEGIIVDKYVDKI